MARFQVVEDLDCAVECPIPFLALRVPQDSQAPGCTVFQILPWLIIADTLACECSTWTDRHGWQVVK